MQERPFDQELLNDIVTWFDISFMAALRCVLGSQFYMGFFAIYDSKGTRQLFKANDTLPYDFLPPRQVPVGSRIYELINRSRNSGYGEVDGEVWCRVDRTNLGVIHENAFHYHNGNYITLIWWKNDEPIWKYIEENEF
ncbi:MAG: hypothetical protein CMP47_10375 [Rickettsiales bacterium]|nr:hypothetical protein [Rickettsiales bacterium]